MALRTLSLFSGAGGLDLAIGIARAHRTVCYVEREAFAAAVLVARMEEGRLDPAPVWSDVGTFDGGPWRGRVDLVTASPPCQPYSLAGQQRGLDDERGRTVLEHVARIVGEVQPRLLFLENVWNWWSGGHFREFGEQLSGLGYICRPPLRLAAADVGATHRRERGFCLAYRDGAGLEKLRGGSVLDGQREACGHNADGRGGAHVADSARGGRRKRGHAALELEPASAGAVLDYPASGGCPRANRPEQQERGPVQAGATAFRPPGPNDTEGWIAVLTEHPGLAPALEPGFCRVVDGVAYGLDDRAARLRCIGNGVDTISGAVAFDVLLAEIGL